MLVLTDSPRLARQLVTIDAPWEEVLEADIDAGLRELSSSIYGTRTLYSGHIQNDGRFNYLLIAEVAELSQYDVSVELCKQGVDIPDGTICLAGAGLNFHGQRERPWSSPEGNIYVTAIFNPDQSVKNFGPGFVMLPAIAVVEACDSLQGIEGRAQIKWVNDILIRNAKIAGVLSYSQAMGDVVTAVVLGIGLNVEVCPRIEPTPFVPDVACLSDFIDDIRICNRRTALDGLLQGLSSNYRLLVEGSYQNLLFKYRRRSAIIGKEVTVCRDDASGESDMITRGTVREIGENLELHIAGYDRSISNGRLILHE
jgi:biotin-[acetyl-CoA-carboxylase] ligase BirA-like protein